MNQRIARLTSCGHPLEPMAGMPSHASVAGHGMSHGPPLVRGPWRTPSRNPASIRRPFVGTMIHWIIAFFLLTLGIDARPAVVGAVKPGNLAWQPAQIKNAINPHQNMVVGDQVSQRPSDEQLQLTAFLPTQHSRLSITDKQSESET